MDERKAHFEKSVWARLFTIFFGLWLLTAPFTFGYKNVIIPQTGIGPKEMQQVLANAEHMVRSDVVTGILVILFGIFSLNYRKIWPSWIVCFLGIWLLFAPILFWTSSAAAYLNDSIIGTLLIAFSILIPKLPYEGAIMGKDVPPGWSYNPSSWLQRLPVVFFGFLGWFISRYLSAYQLGLIPDVWDPFFGEGTFEVVTSDLSKSFPISDAGLGAIAYALEALMGLKGSPRRWRTMPWMVITFGILVVPLGFVSILLVMSQPIVVGAWCGLCLVTAAGMLIMIALTVDEVIAVLQFLNYTRKKRLPFWTTFWKGGVPEGATDDQTTPQFSDSYGRWKAMIRGSSTIPWNLLVSALLGLWMMCVPQVLHVMDGSANADHIAGALTITLSVIAFAEVTRAIRYVNVPLGIFIALSPWIFTGSGREAGWNNLIVGLLLILLSFRKGKVVEHYGTWDKNIV